MLLYAKSNKLNLFYLFYSQLVDKNDINANYSCRHMLSCTVDSEFYTFLEINEQ